MDFRKLAQQAQQMQQQMEREIGDASAEATVGGGMVTAKIDGHKRLVALNIDPQAVDPEDCSMLEDLIVAAVNEAGRKLDEQLRSKVGSLAPGLSNLL